MIKAGIIGATGYAGNEIVRLLLGHKDVEIKWFGSRSYIDQQYADIYQNFFRLVDAKCMDDNMAALADEVDVIFTATPQGLCASLINEEILSKCKVIDLSADFRIKDVKKYEKWYGIEHKAPQFIEEAVYGLCEINREDIKKARLIANPGCYPTCSTLSIYPLLKEGLIDPNTNIVKTLGYACWITPCWISTLLRPRSSWIITLLPHCWCTDARTLLMSACCIFLPPYFTLYFSTVIKFCQTDLRVLHKIHEYLQFFSIFECFFIQIYSNTTFSSRSSTFTTIYG